MQSPVKITNSENCSILDYGLIERGSNGVNLASFLTTTERNAVTAVVGGTDPIVEIPSIVSAYKYLSAQINAKTVWYIPGDGTFAGLLINQELPLIAFNNVSPTSLLIKQNGQPLQNMILPKCVIELKPEPGNIDFTSFTVKYAIPAAGTFWGNGPATAPTTNIMQIFVYLKLIAHNGTN